MYPELLKFQNIQCKDNLQMINIGTGMGYYDLDYEGMPICAFNFALPQQNLQFDYKLLKNYKYLFQQNCKILIVLPYCIFCAHFFGELEYIYERYYSILPEYEVSSYSRTSFREYKLKTNGYCLDKKLELFEPLNELEMETQAEETINIWKNQLKIVSFLSGEISEHVRNEMQESKKWFGNIVDFCFVNQFEPIIIVPPMSKVLLDKISLEFRETHFYSILHEVVHDEVMILDYTKDEKYCNPQLYGWPGFLVNYAAKDFTKDIMIKLAMF